jgi:hypothetical protein
MSSFKNRFWGIQRLKPSSTNGTSLREQVEPYLNWRVVAIDDNAILLCKYTTTTSIQSEDMIIIEGILMETWLEHRQEGV